MVSALFGNLPGIDPLSFPDAVFQGDQIVATLRGRNLEGITTIRVRPAKGITCQLGAAEGMAQVQTTDTITVTVCIDRTTPPGEKYLWVQSPTADSNQIMFIVML